MPASPAARLVAPSKHYENFPVASWLCPPRLRPPIAAIYRFARTADDLADEGEANASERLDDLRAFGDDLAAVARGAAASGRWPEVFLPLAQEMHRFQLPEHLLADLLSAFTQDVRNTHDGQGHADCDSLLDYCRRSANPIGRLLLHLYGVDDPRALAQSDAICSALQLTNFWQDLSVDLPRGRFYVPTADSSAHGLDRDALRRCVSLPPVLVPPEAKALISKEIAWTRALMHQGAPLVHRLAGRVGWELRLVVQGGLRILEKIEASGYGSFCQRPVIAKSDTPLLIWRALRMSRQSAA